MLSDVLIPNMIFFYGSNNFKTTNTYPITLGENVGNQEFWVGDLTPLSHGTFHPQYTKLVILCPVLSTNYTTSDYLLSNHMRISAHITTPTTVGLTRPFCLQTANPGYMKSYECCQGLENMTSYWFKKRVLPSRSSVSYWLSWRGCFFSFPAQPEGLRCASNVILEKKINKGLNKKMSTTVSHLCLILATPRGMFFLFRAQPEGLRCQAVLASNVIL